MFVDEVDIQVHAGAGGRGAVSFRREKFVPRGGPNGGDGGSGGSVVLVASPHLNTLVGFRYHPEFRAERGAHGEGSNRTGRNGRDLTLEVPIGTVVYELTPDGPHFIGDLSAEGERLPVARGGNSSKVATRRKSATNGEICSCN